MTNLTAIKGDITTAEVDAIVNAANPVMLGGGGVDGAIHKAAGIKLLEACKAVELKDGVRCPTGEARITEAGNLNAKYVIHTVGPRYSVDDVNLLKKCYINSILKADELGVNSISFPAISTNIYGVPVKLSAEMVKLVFDELPEPKHLKVINLVFNKQSDIESTYLSCYDI